MRILKFKISNQGETEDFIRSIYEEMGWLEYWEKQFSNFYQHGEPNHPN